MITITREVLEAEVSSCAGILNKWSERLKEIPHIDIPGSEEQLGEFVRTLVFELQLAAGKCNNLADALRGE